MIIRTEHGEYTSSTINSLDGAQQKWQSGERYYKIDKYGYESLAEMLVSELEEYIVDFPHVNYYHELKVVNDEQVRVCWSENCKNDDEVEYTFYDILKKSGSWYGLQSLSGKDALKYVIEVVDKFIGYEGTRHYLSRIFFLDAITLNGDKHLNNLSALVSRDGSIRFFPVMDNGLSLLANTTEYPLNLDLKSAMSLVVCQPFTSSFDRQCGYLRDCKKLQIRYNVFLDRINTALNNPKDYLYYGKPVFERMCKILQIRLKRLEGVVWERV